MNWEQLEGKWEQVRGKIKEKWGKLTDSDLTAITGKKEQLIGKLHERYGYDKERAEHEISSLIENCGCAPSAAQEKKPKKQANS